jgi:hypothetical protein
MHAYLQAPSAHSHWLERKIAYYYKRLHSPAFTIQGRSRYGGFPIQMLFIGSHPIRDDLIVRVLEDDFLVTPLGMTPVYRLTDLIKKNDQCDVVFTEWHSFPHRIFSLTADFFLPAFMKMEICLCAKCPPLERRGALSEVRRRIRKANLTYSVRTDLDSFDDFYFNMYLPHIQSRYGRAALQHDYEDLKSRFSEYELLMVRSEGEDLAGALLKRDQTVGSIVYLGVKGGSPSLIKAGVTGALYYYSFLHFSAQGLPKANLGGVRPFLNDGVLKYKLEMGAVFSSSHVDEAGLLGLKINRKNAAVKTLFENLPFIAYEKPEHYSSVYLVTDAPSAAASDFKGLTHRVLPIDEVSSRYRF